MLKINDSLNNQFKFYTYLNKLNDTIIQYLDNNNVDVNYYCIFEKEGIIITSNTIKRIDCGYRLIKITVVKNEFSTFKCSVNKICYENMLIEISNPFDNINDQTANMSIIINDQKFFSCSNEIDLLLKYNKDMDESLVTTVHNVYNCRQLEIFKNITVISCIGSQSDYINFPPKIHTLELVNNFYNLLPGALPKNLHTLKLGSYYTREIVPNTLPYSLHTLKLGDLYNSKFIKNVLPPNLNTLILGNSYQHDFEQNILPPNLDTLVLGKYYDKPIGPNTLPSNLQNIIFKSCYKFDNVLCIFPQNLKNITLRNSENLPKFPPSLNNLTIIYNYRLRDSTKYVIKTRLKKMLPHNIKITILEISDDCVNY
jgi:hypothetical protein